MLHIAPPIALVCGAWFCESRAMLRRGGIRHHANNEKSVRQAPDQPDAEQINSKWRGGRSGV